MICSRSGIVLCRGLVCRKEDAVLGSMRPAVVEMATIPPSPAAAN
jgi:hypothetical protein